MYKQATYNLAIGPTPRQLHQERKLHREAIAEALWTCVTLEESNLVSLPPIFRTWRAAEAQRRMAPDGIVEAINIPADGVFGFGSSLEDGAPDELGFQRFEERLDHRIVVTIAFAGHRSYAGKLVTGLGKGGGVSVTVSADHASIEGLIRHGRE
jgi:hypothetical protein